MQVIGEFCKMVDVDLMKDIFMFLMRMSDDGVGAEAYSHADMRKIDSFCFCMYRILVLTGEMVDVENEAYFLIF